MDALARRSRAGVAHVVDIVKRRRECVEKVEQKSINVGDPSAWLALNSRYATSKARDRLIDEGQKPIGSVKRDRFPMETAMTHRLHAADKIGEWRSIYSHETSEALTYRYDAQRGVGKKRCVSHGLARAIDNSTVKDCSGQIPAYSHYKSTLETCDAALVERSTTAHGHTHEVGGTSGDMGCHHDFLMACVMQNVRNARLALSESDPLSYSFEDMIKDSAYELYSYSVDL